MQSLCGALYEVWGAGRENFGNPGSVLTCLNAVNVGEFYWPYNLPNARIEKHASSSY